jgi:peroxiredoxin
MERIGKYAPDFEIPGVNGEVHHLARYLESYRAVAVVFLGNDCPVSRAYLKRLKALHGELEPKGAMIIGINSNSEVVSPGDSFVAMKGFYRDRGLNFPYLWDSTQDVAQGFRAEVTPQVFAIDAESRIRYIGAIDNATRSSDEPTEPYLRNALLEILAGKPVTVPFTAAVGCAVKWRK